VLASFLPPQLSDYVTVDAVGSSGGIITIWDPQFLSLTSSRRDRFSLSTVLLSTLSALTFVVTNVYAPADHSLTPIFLEELESLGPLFNNLPWMIVGDFNLLRCPTDKNNPSFDLSLANAFNDSICSLALFELPLLDRLCTWSNKRETPVLARLDRALFNQAWNLALSNSSLSSLPRPTFDHVPLLVTTATKIPRAACFRFENSWLKNPPLPPFHSPCLGQSSGHR
jgi:hypothetical protein